MSATGGQDELDRAAPIFEGVVPLRVCADRAEPKTIDATIRVLHGWRSSGGSSSLRQRLLVIEVADESDPFFHHSLAVGEAEFTELKAEQSILVEFGAFPAHFVELLQCCGGRGGEGAVGTAATATPLRGGDLSPQLQRVAPLGASASGSSAGSFGLQLSVRDPAPGAPSTLAVVETNPFKHLTHLSLALRSSNDASLKRYLAARLTHTQTLLKRSVDSCRASDGALERARAGQEAAAGELAMLRSDAASRDAALRAAAAAEASAAREASAAALSVAEAAARRAMAEAEERHATALAALRARADEQAAALLVSERAKAAAETSLREAAHRAGALTSELEATGAEAARLRAALAESEAGRTASAREASSLALRLAVAEQSAADRAELLSRTQALTEAGERGRAAAEESLALYKASVAKLQEKLEASVAEIHRGNAIIGRLQDEYRAAKARLRGQADATRAAEALAAERERSLTDAQRELHGARAEAARVRSEKDAADVGAAALRAQLAEASATILRNSEVIAWLNKELNEAQQQQPQQQPAPGVRQLYTPVATYRAAATAAGVPTPQAQSAAANPAAGGGRGGFPGASLSASLASASAARAAAAGSGGRTLPLTGVAIGGLASPGAVSLGSPQQPPPPAPPHQPQSQPGDGAGGASRGGPAAEQSRQGGGWGGAGAYDVSGVSSAASPAAAGGGANPYLLLTQAQRKQAAAAAASGGQQPQQPPPQPPQPLSAYFS